ncbi:phospho-sugar mutase [Streptomyces sp. YIM 98790]|uniref:phospho-sugar mutase n=1 Tax=Streptomyces sp. YIM 98790 TaxID=2689077 RepID=UPI0014079A71|nr:phospho-sugar mutase [Streptomyces sp. YIM 98790]
MTADSAPAPVPDAGLLHRARTWLAEDPDPQTRAELAGLIDRGDAGALAERFSGTLQFGTAGLRGELGAGPMRMNRAVVLRAAAGLAAYLRKRPTDDGAPGLVVIGRDARHKSADFARDTAAVMVGAGLRAVLLPRPLPTPVLPTDDGAPGLVVIGRDARHKSADFARDTAAVMVGAGLRAVLLPRPLPTPVLAFAIRHLGAVAGVAVTASHNPPQDNGYKVYLGEGSQIVPPADADIAAEIAAVGPLADIPLLDTGWETLGEEVVEAYLDRTSAVLTPGSPRTARIVYTPLHGVGAAVVRESFARAGFPAPVMVEAQAAPDPDFPTVAFPNPEEPGAMDLAYETAARAALDSPDLILANDPDADRCAVAVPDGRRDSGWRMLHGDQVGALLAAHLLRKGVTGTFAASIVSSSLVGKMAAAAGQPYRETLTGFKWLARVDGLAYAYEEALGYCVDPGGVRDKDGITAALAVAELASELKAEGRTLTDLLDELAVRHGLHATDQLSVRVKDLSVIAGAMRRLRERPPAELAGRPVLRFEDLALGGADDAAGGTLPPTDGLRLTLDDARVIVRPSGTEPKLKCYLEVRMPVASAAELSAARSEATGVLDRLKRDLARTAGL